jgi:hypothetical protein
MIDNYGVNQPTFAGSIPLPVQWKVVRGDDASIRFMFYQDDGVTLQNTTGWTYAASAYDLKTSTKYTLTCVPGTSYVDVSVSSSVSTLWGTGVKPIVNELVFDVQTTVNGLKTTIVLGSIPVIGDITGATL